MSWLIPLFLAGAMFASGGGNVNNLPAADFKGESANVKTVVQQQQRRQTDETERFEQTYPLSATGKVSVSNVNGSITIDVWDNPQVKLEYVKIADTRERLAEIEVKIDARPDAIDVETNFDKWKRNENRNWNKNSKFEVQYHLTVPRTAILDEIAAVNGSVNIKDAGNLTKASTVNGEVNATNLRGAANLSTVNGVVNVDFDQLQPGGRIALNTVNGQINLMIPSNADATVLAFTVNGNITNDFNLAVRKGRFIGRSLSGKIGGGETKIKLSGVNGNLSLKRRNDGKTMSAAMDIKPDRNDEDGWDFGDDEKIGSRVRAPRPPRAPRVPRVPAAPDAPEAPPAPDGEINDEEINRTIQEGLKEAQKEIGNLKPELARASAEAIKQAAANINSREAQARLKEAQANLKVVLANANWTNAAPRIEDKSESFKVEGVPRVTLEAAGNCGVVVRGWDKREVRYAATRVSKTQTPLDLTATQNGSDITIKIGGESANNAPFNEMSRARIEIFVPAKSDLKIKTGGEIRLEGVSGALDLQGAGESINVRDAGGKLSAQTSDGTIRVVGFRGAFIGKTGDGAMNLEGDFDSLDALAAGDGAIILTLPENAGAVLESNAEIESDGVNLTRENAKEKLWRVGQGDATYRFSVEDGRVLVRGANALKSIL